MGYQSKSADVFTLIFRTTFHSKRNLLESTIVITIDCHYLVSFRFVVISGMIFPWYACIRKTVTILIIRSSQRGKPSKRDGNN